MKDEEIIELYLERDEKAIAATAEKYGSYCHSISYNILQNAEDAQECVNDTWLGAWKSIPPYRPNQMATYLGKITRNLSLNRFKHYAAEKRGLGQAELALSELEECIPAQGSIEQIIEEMSLTKSINRFLYAQPQQKRNIFIRRYWYGDPVKELAAERGEEANTLSQRLLRLRKNLRAFLESEGVEL